MTSKKLLWPELIPGTLIRRYKRFLADVELENGETVTAHCPNSGSMTACCAPGSPVYLSYHDNPRRKLKYTWELIRMPGSLVGVNTLVPNRLVCQSVEGGFVKELDAYDTVRREVRVGSHSRLDLLLEKGEQEKCFVEIKNCTLVEEDGTAYFPDAVTLRGRKHLAELERLALENRCVMFFLIQRCDAKIFRPADHIDPEYGKKLRVAASQGVEILVYDVRIDLEGIALNRKLSHIL
ncbi:MAG: sugar fermentation stimulation protein SfsA [Desulfobacteraceae bacterium 4572_88]|nr:MAG: sugar fermentation stimulation protein SfsA [Desulfobacteraceae bacterium 4572_88]